MRTAVSRLALLSPRSLRDALTMLRDEAPLEPIAGCTDVYVALNAGTLKSRRFLDLWPMEELRAIEVRDGVLSIGALATYAAVRRSRLVARRLPMLALAAREVGGAQVQNRGTIGGNVANASPAGDTLPVFLAAEAAVVLMSSVRGERRVAFTEFYTGYRTTVRRPDELIAAIEVPRVPGAQWFRKVGTRAAQAISKVVVAAVRAPGAPPRIALGSVAPTAVRARRAESLLAAGAPIAEARAALEREIRPIDDLRSTAAYRRRVAGNLLELFWRETERTA